MIAFIAGLAVGIVGTLAAQWVRANPAAAKAAWDKVRGR